MFERTFSFWRRLVGKPSAPSQEAPAERRLWVRYPANVQTAVQVADRSIPQQRFQAQVRDISLGGANLVVDSPFESGQMLSVELPCYEGAETHTVLACVVRSENENGHWALGCVFSRELTDEDLQGFGARRERHPHSDQRTWMRFRTDRRAIFQKVGGVENQNFTAQVINLSASGVGLCVAIPVDNGTLLSVRLEGSDGEARTILACVVHVAHQEGGDYALGCNFIRELSEEDLKALV